MGYEAFGVDIRFQEKTLKLIEQANYIIGLNQAAGYTLTLRQLYYQFVKRNWLKNTALNYGRLGSVVDDARKKGLIDWDAIEDRGRNLMSVPNYRDPAHFLKRTIDAYAEDLWRDQEYYCELWVEKDALTGVVERPCNELRVPYFACKGYVSTSELYRAGKRFEDKALEGYKTILFHIGDHDPSGIDMTRNNREMTDMYASGVGPEVIRLALNMDQVREFDLPPNYAKNTDSKTDQYVEAFGSDECWELDALDNADIDRIIREAIDEVLDRELFDANLKAEEVNRDLLHSVRKDWTTVERFVQHKDKAMTLPPQMNEGDPRKWSANDILDLMKKPKK